MRIKRLRVIWLLFLTLVLFNCGDGTHHTDDVDNEDYDAGYPPYSPTLTSAKVISDSEIDLGFITYDSTIGIKIERYSDADGEYLLIATVADGTTAYQDTGLEGNTSYTYRLQAYNSYGVSEYSNTRGATTYCHGYSLCTAHNSVFGCTRSSCGTLTEKNLTDSVAGPDVFVCLGSSLQTAKTMTVTFDYRAWADSCYNRPVFTVRVGTQSVSFNYSCQTSPMAEGTVSIAVPIGTTLNDISFDLTSGDWGAQVVITSITFSP